jgi:hypothetical protein
MRSAWSAEANLAGGNLRNQHGAVDFAAIRARMKELRRERERAEAAEIELQGDPRGDRGAAVKN